MSELRQLTESETSKVILGSLFFTFLPSTHPLHHPTRSNWPSNTSWISYIFSILKALALFSFHNFSFLVFRWLSSSLGLISVPRLVPSSINAEVIYIRAWNLWTNCFLEELYRRTLQLSIKAMAISLQHCQFRLLFREHRNIGKAYVRQPLHSHLSTPVSHQPCSHRLGTPNILCLVCVFVNIIINSLRKNWILYSLRHQIKMSSFPPCNTQCISGPLPSANYELWMSLQTLTDFERWTNQVVWSVFMRWKWSLKL